MIRIQQLSKSFAQRAVLNRASAEFERGQLTAIIGPNGAGKSTLLSAASRLIKADHGVVYIDGTSLEDWHTQTLAKRLAVLRQSNPLSVRLSVRELIAFGRFPHSKGRLNEEDQAVIDRAIDYLQLGEIQDQHLDTLSGGQRQLAFIGMVIAQDTDYVLLDEPLNNLDIQHAKRMMGHLKALAQVFGKSVVIVIHDINFACCYADRIVALKRGEIVAQGPTDTIMNAEKLSEIYESTFRIVDIDGQRLCHYY